MNSLVRSYDHDQQYGLDLRLALIAALGLMVLVFRFAPQPEVHAYELRRPIVQAVRIEPVLLAPQVPDQPVPRRSAIPVPSPDGPATDPSIGRHTFNEVERPLTEPVLEPLPYWKVERKPVLVSSVVPEYPELARRAGIEGSVVVAAVVDTNGLVASATVLRSSGNSLLDAAALTAARQFRFVPAYQNDRPVPVQVSIPFRFSLE